MSMKKPPMTNEQLIDYLLTDLKELLPEQKRAEADGNSYWDYLSGIIDRTQNVLRMLGVPEHKIPEQLEELDSE